MLAAVFRRVLLSYASHFFTNVEVENLSLWSGTVAIENVDINTKEMTAFLGLRGVQMTSGTLGRIEMQVPWAALTSSSLELTLKEVNIEFELGNYKPEPMQPVEPALEAEESLVQKILANVKVHVQRLAVVLRFKGDSQYCLKTVVSEIDFGTTDHDWEYKFVNPFSLTEGGTVYRHHRMLQVLDLEIRVISGGRDDFLSNTVLGHKFENQDCKNCALCYAFKASSFYTLASCKPCSLSLYLYTASEKTQSLKPGFMSYCSATETTSMDLRFTSPVQAKCCFVEESRVMKDVTLLLSNLAPEEQETPKARVTVPTVMMEDPTQSWFSWGKEILFPIYCTAPGSHLMKVVRCSSGLLSLTLPQLQCQIKVFNPSTLELSKLKLFVTEFTHKKSTRRTVTTDPNYSPVENWDEAEGNCHEFLFYVYLKSNYAVIRLANLRFGVKDETVSFSGSDADVQVTHNGQQSKSIGSKVLEGKLICGETVSVQTNLEQIMLTFTPEEIMVFAEAMIELNSFYSRLVAPATATFPTLDALLSHRDRTPRKSIEEKCAEAEHSLGQMKAVLLSLHAQLFTAQDEAARLRSVLTNAVGGSAAALAGLMSIDPGSVRAVCQEAKNDNFPVKAVLTTSQLVILSMEGRQMDKIDLKTMTRLEEKGEQELTIHTDDLRLVRLTLRCELRRNRSEFVKGINQFFGN